MGDMDGLANLYADPVLAVVRNAVPRHMVPKGTLHLCQTLQGDLAPPDHFEDDVYRMPMESEVRLFDSRKCFKNIVFSIYKAEVSIGEGGLLEFWLWSSLLAFYENRAGEYNDPTSTGAIGLQMMLNHAKVDVRLLRDRIHPTMTYAKAMTRSTNQLLRKLHRDGRIFHPYPADRLRQIRQFLIQPSGGGPDVTHAVIDALGEVVFLIGNRQFTREFFINAIKKMRIFYGDGFGGSTILGMVLRNGIFLNKERFDLCGPKNRRACELVVASHETAHLLVRETERNFNASSPVANYRPEKQMQGSGLHQAIESGIEMEFKLCDNQMVDWASSDERVGELFLQNSMLNAVPIFHVTDFDEGQLQEYATPMIPFFGSAYDPNADHVAH